MQDRAVTNGGFVDMTGSSSEEDSISNSSTPPVAETSPRTPRRAKQQKTSPASSKTANPWATRVMAFKKERPAWVDDIDAILGDAEDYEHEVHTAELPYTQDFGGAQALIDLQSEHQDIDDNSSPDTEN